MRKDQDQSQTQPPFLSGDFEGDIALIRRLFRDVDIMLSRRFCNHANKNIEFCLFFSDGVTNSETIHEHMIKPLIMQTQLPTGGDLLPFLRDRVLLVGDMHDTANVKEIIEAITYGDTLLLIRGCEAGILLNSKSFALRGISEPEGEKVLSGPREGFTEGIMQNLSLVRRRLRTNHLKMKMRTAGRQSTTAMCICYLDNIVNETLLTQLYERLDDIDIDAVLDSNYIAEYIAEYSLVGFQTFGATERPDVVAGKLLEGRIALFVDGSPMVLTVPYLMIENFQSNEDYYTNPYYATFSRILRIVGFALTIAVPALYVAVVAYHPELMPAELMINFATQRQGVPLPASVESILMLLIFDVLRETGVRTPSHIGQALSIVGALVIGDAAVSASLVTAPMVIVVAFTGITNLLIPRMTTASLFSRYFLLLSTIFFGMLGFVVGCVILICHVLNLYSFGIPYLLPIEQLSYQQVKDTFIRAPWPRMLTRITPISTNKTRARARKESAKRGLR